MLTVTYYLDNTSIPEVINTFHSLSKTNFAEMWFCPSSPNSLLTTEYSIFEAIGNRAAYLPACYCSGTEYFKTIPHSGLT